MTLHESLKDHAFVAGMTDSQLSKLADLAHEVSFHENELVLRAGQRSGHFYLLLTGSVCVEVRTQSYMVSVQVLKAGEAFGWSSLLERQDTLFEVVARERCTALCLDSEALAAAFHEDPALALEMFRRALKLAARRVYATEETLAEFCGVRRQRRHANLAVPFPNEVP